MTLESSPPQFVLNVKGTKPFLNMEVDLVPLVFIRQPEQWGIEIVGRLRGVGLPALAPYTVSIPVTGLLGTRGIEVIGATRSEKIAVPAEEPTRDCDGWSAMHDRQPPDPAVLRVRGECRFPVTGFQVEPRRREPQAQGRSGNRSGRSAEGNAFGVQATRRGIEREER